MSFGDPWGTPFYSGGGVSSLVPSQFEFAIAGRVYMIDTRQGSGVTVGDIPVQRAQADTNNNPSEATLSTEGLWRRTLLSWHKGSGQCLAPETRVLTADLRWVPVGELKVGDSLVAFEEERSTRNARQWRQSTVTGTGRIRKPCYRLLLEDGTKIVASHDHKWLKEVAETYSWARTERVQAASRAPSRATKLLRILRPWDEEHSWSAGYLAAAFDGEGCLTQTKRPPRKDRLMVTFAQCDNAMLALVRHELHRHGFQFSERQTHQYKSAVHHLNLLGGTAEVLRFLGSVRPRRLMAKFQPLDNGVVYGDAVRVLECEFIGEQEVVALSTTTETFIAEGFASHNTNYDRPESDPFRYLSSSGLDPWTRFHLSTLPATALSLTSANTNLRLAVAGGRLYVADGHVIRYTTDLTNWTAITGNPASDALSLASDGATLYVAYGADGLYTVASGAAAMTSYATGTVSRVGYAKGRLLVVETTGADPRVYNVVATGAVTAGTLLLTVPGGVFPANQWTAEGPNSLYCLPAEAEILTRRGWLRSDEATTEDDALGYDPITRSIKWTPVERVNRFAFKGALTQWSSSTLDVMSTADHRWMVEPRNRVGRHVEDAPAQFLTTEAMEQGHSVRSVILGGGRPEEFLDHPTFTDEFVELIGWVVTEGHYTKAPTYQPVGVVVVQSERVNPEYTARLRRLAKFFSEGGATATAHARAGGMVEFYFGTGIGNLIREVAPGKQLTPTFLASLTLDQAELLYETLLDGDGTRGGGRTVFIQKDEGRIGGFQMLCAMLGRRTRWTRLNAAADTVIVYRRRRARRNRFTTEQVPYEGEVWCPTTGTGTWMVRYRGRTFWTGNCVAVVGDQSRLWRTSVKSDGTALDAPVKAGELPDGELVRSVQGYLGSVLFVGTDGKVWTFGFDGAGNLRQLGNFDTAAPVYGFEPQESFVWYGGAASATLGRMDLRTNVSPDPTTGFTPGGFTPGYANDLAAALTGDVQSVATFNDRRAFTVSGRGVYVQAATKVTSGTLDTGIISFGLADLKNVLFADVHFQPLGSGDKVTVEVSKDGGAYALAGIAMLPGSVSATVPLGQLLAETISLRLTVTGNATVTALTARCVPAPQVGQIMRVPLLLWRDGKDIHGAPYTWDALFERNYLANLRRDRTAVAVQHGAEPLTAIVNRLTEWHEEAKAPAADGSWSGQWEGTLVLDLLLIDG